MSSALTGSSYTTAGDPSVYVKHSAIFWSGIQLTNMCYARNNDLNSSQTFRLLKTCLTSRCCSLANNGVLNFTAHVRWLDEVTSVEHAMTSFQELDETLGSSWQIWIHGCQYSSRNQDGLFGRWALDLGSQTFWLSFGTPWSNPVSFDGHTIPSYYNTLLWTWTCVSKPAESLFSDWMKGERFLRRPTSSTYPW